MNPKACNIVTLDWATMLTLVSFVAVIGFTWGCTPIIVHPQTTYCGSNVVAKIKIESLTNGYYALGRTRTTDSYFIYNGIILDIIKGTGLMSTQSNKTRESNNMKHVQVLTAAESSMCGPITLTVGETYLISGDFRDEGSVVASIYNGAILLANETQYDELRRQMDLYKLLGCDCKVDASGVIYVGYKEGQENRCTVMTIPGCHSDTGGCVKLGGRCTYMQICENVQNEKDVQIKMSDDISIPPV